MGLERYYKFCPHGCGKSVKYVGCIGTNKIRTSVFACDRCGHHWKGIISLFEHQIKVGLRESIPNKYKAQRKKVMEGGF